MNHWILEDAEFLKRNNRKRSCLCLLLCHIDSLSKNKFPFENSNRKRYVDYLKESLKQIELDTRYRIEEKNKLLHLSEIIYEYFRCFLVHETCDRTKTEFEVQLEFESSGKFCFNSGILIDRVHEKIIIRADWLINIIESIINLGDN